MRRPGITFRRSALAALVVAIGLGLAGCGSDDEGDSASGETASAEYCAALAAAVSEGEKLATILEGEPAVAEIEAQRNKLADAYGTIGETNSNTEGALEETVSRAFAEFDTAIDQLSPDLPAAELAVAYQEQVGTLLDSLEDVTGEAGC